MHLSRGGQSVWRATVHGGGTSKSFTMPVPPQGVADPLVGPIQARLFTYGYAPGFDPNDYETGDEVLQIRARANSKAMLEFDDPSQSMNPYRCDASAPPPLQNGGTGGGPIAGDLVIHAIGAKNERVRGAIARIIQGSTTITATAGADGCIKVVRAGLAGAVDVHLHYPGRASASWVGVNARQLTIPIPTIGDGAASPQPVTISGTVRGLDVLSATTATVARIAIVDRVTTDLYGPEVFDETRMGTTISTRTVLVGSAESFDFRDYVVRSNPERLLGLFVQGGTYVPSTDEIVLTHIGLDPNVTGTPGQVITGRDLTLVEPLDRVLTVSHSATTASERLVFGLMVLPSGGVVVLEADERENVATSTFAAPSTSGLFAGARYGGLVQMQAPGSFQVAIDYGDATPVRSLTLPALPSVVERNGRTISAEVDANAGLVNVVFTANQKIVWVARSYRPSASFSVELPPVPRGITDRLTGPISVRVEVVGYAPGADPTSFDQVREEWRAIRTVAAREANFTF